MTVSGEGPGPFQQFLSRQAAQNDLESRERLQVLRRTLAEAPALQPLTRLWSGPESVILGGWYASLDDWVPDEIHDAWSFLGIKLDQNQEFSRLRKVKLKVRKPFVISVSEPDEYLLHQLRALGCDAVMIAVSERNIVDIQFLIEVARDLGMDTILECRDEADCRRMEQTDGRFFSCPVQLAHKPAFKTAVAARLPILRVDRLNDLDQLSQMDCSVGVLVNARMMQSNSS